MFLVTTYPVLDLLVWLKTGLLLWIEIFKITYLRKTAKIVFNHTSKHRKDSWKKKRSRVFFTNFEVLEIWFNAVLSGWFIFSMEIKANLKTTE